MMHSFVGVLYGPRFNLDDTVINPLLEIQSSRWKYGSSTKDINHDVRVDVSQESPLSSLFTEYL